MERFQITNSNFKILILFSLTQFWGIMFLIGPEVLAKENNCNGVPSGHIPLHNWGGNFRFCTQNIQYPRTEQEVKKIVVASRKVRVVGSRHSFSEIANTNETLISTLGMNKILRLDAKKKIVTVQSGITYTDLAPFLYDKKFALENIAALAEISVGGAIQTGTHGSGPTHANLASQVRRVRLVLANGTAVEYSSTDKNFNAIVVGLGAFGVLTELDLALVPAFKTRICVFLNVINFNRDFDEIMSSAYSVQYVTPFIPTPQAPIRNFVWVTERQNLATGKWDTNICNKFVFHGGILSPLQVPLYPGVSTNYFTEQKVTHPWYYGLVGYRFGQSGFDGDEIQTEYFVPYKNAAKAISAVEKVFTKNPAASNFLFGMLARTIKSDNFWLSTASSSFGDKDCKTDTVVSIHFSWKNNMDGIEKVLPCIEAAIAQYCARPHWGKVHTMSANSYLCRYPKLQEFRAKAKQFDPKEKFINDYLQNSVFLTQATTDHCNFQSEKKCVSP